MIPRSAREAAALASSADIQLAERLAWGEGDVRQAKSAMREANKQREGKAMLPQVRIALMCAAGPSGERQEHLDDIVKFAGVSQRRRLFKAIDDLTIKWAIGSLPDQCRWNCVEH